MFYVGKDNKSLVKCVGDIKRADFGKELLTLSYEFFVRERQENLNDQ